MQDHISLDRRDSAAHFSGLGRRPPAECPWLPHAPSLNEMYVDMIIPAMVNELSQAEINDALKKAGVDNPTRDENFLSSEEELPEDEGIEGTMYDTLYKALTDYNTALLSRKQSIENTMPM